ncbi:MAG: four helix bundle protein [Candidatus Acidiferrales bacterium]
MAPDSTRVTHYKELKIWQKGMSLAKSVYRLTMRFPADERFGLSAQMRRAAVSVPSNIAEGQARHGTREFLQFLSHASGSLAELETQVLLSMDLGYCKESEVSSIANEIGELQKMVAAIRRKLVVV